MRSPGKQILERGAQLVTLTGIAQIELARKAASAAVHPLGRDLLAGALFQLPEDLLRVIRADFGERAKLRTNVVVHHVGAEKPQRREGAGLRRHQNARDAELGCNGGRVDGAGTAERQ